MPKPNPHRPVRIDPAQAALIPDVSGNAVNGLGERARRPARTVYWAPDPDAIPHGAMQRWFYGVDPENPDLAQARAERAARLAEALPEVEGAPAVRTPADWTAALEGFVAAGDCEKVGVAEMDPAWVTEGHSIDAARVIVLGVVHDWPEISTAPEPRAGAEVIRQYGRAGAAAKRVAGWLRGQGWPAEPVTGPMSGPLLLIPPALACGFGELGKHGSAICPEFGSSFRLAAVLTDAPFAPTPARTHGIDAFCAACRVCEDACPPLAIGPEKQWVRGERKWYVDFDACLPYFNQTHGCGICIAVCPWSRPGVGESLAAKLARRAARGADD